MPSDNSSQRIAEISNLDAKRNVVGGAAVTMDITERKRAEEELRYHANLIDNVSDAIISTDKELKIRSWNRAAERMYGWRADEVIGLKGSDVLQTTFPEGLSREAIAKDIFEKGGWEGELIQRTKDGRDITVHARSMALRDEAGVVIGGVSISYGVTERKQAEVALQEAKEEMEISAEELRLQNEELICAQSALHESESRLAAELDAMTRLQKLGTLFVQKGELEPVLGEIVDAAIAISCAGFGNIQILDPKSSELKIEAQRGFPVWWIDFWNSVSKGQGACGTALEQGARVIVEDVEQSSIFIGTPALEIQRKTGVRAVQSTPLVSRSGKPLGMFSTHYKTPQRPDDRALRLLDLLAHQAADIIERAQAEEALQKQAELIDLSPDAIMTLQLDGTITFWSQGAQALYGWAGREALGQHVHTLLKTRFQQPLEQIIGQVQQTGHWSGEFIHSAKDGRQVAVQSRWQARFDDQGSVRDTGVERGYH